MNALVQLADFKARAETESDAARMQNIFRAHETLANLLVSLIDDLNFDLVLQSESAAKRSSKTVKELVAVQISGLRNALEIAAQTHLVTNLISEGSIAKDAAMLVPIQDRFKASTALLQKVSKTLSQDEIKTSIASCWPSVRATAAFSHCASASLRRRFAPIARSRKTSGFSGSSTRRFRPSSAGPKSG